MSFTPPKKEKLTGVLAIIVYLAAGLLLLIRPDIMNELTRWTLTIVLGAWAIIQAVRYFRTPAEKAAEGYSLTSALIAATFALIAYLNTDWLTYRLWGILILIGGYLKFQTTWDFFRLGHVRWWWILIGTAVSFLLGILIITGVLPADVTVWFGISLLIEAVLDIAMLIMVAKGDKWNTQRPHKAAEEKPHPAKETASDKNTDNSELAEAPQPAAETTEKPAADPAPAPAPAAADDV